MKRITWIRVFVKQFVKRMSERKIQRIDAEFFQNQWLAWQKQ